jgi:hypothetical protein
VRPAGAPPDASVRKPVRLTELAALGVSRLTRKALAVRLSREGGRYT